MPIKLGQTSVYFAKEIKKSRVKFILYNMNMGMGMGILVHLQSTVVPMELHNNNWYSLSSEFLRSTEDRAKSFRLPLIHSTAKTQCSLQAAIARQGSTSLRKLWNEILSNQRIFDKIVYYKNMFEAY